MGWEKNIFTKYTIIISNDFPMQFRRVWCPITECFAINEIEIERNNLLLFNDFKLNSSTAGIIYSERCDSTLY